MNEIWKDVKGFEGRYQVSNLGRVRSLDWHGHKGRILKQKIGKLWGYYRLNLAHADGYIKSVNVHRLVAIAFLPNPDNLPEINHKDENKLNNVVCLNPDGSIDTEHTNLEWCTGLYNLRYGTRIERMQKLINEPRMRAVSQYDFDGNLLHTYKSLAEASEKTGISIRSICHICKKNGAHSSHGYVFRYSDDDSPWVSFDKNKCRGNKERMRAVDQYDKNGQYIKTYESCNKASKESGLSPGSIWSVLSGKQKTTHGYIFRYSDGNSK